MSTEDRPGLSGPQEPNFALEPTRGGPVPTVGRYLDESNEISPRTGADIAVEGEGRSEKVLLFRVAYLELAIPLERIRIVQRSEGIDPLPESPRNVVGLMQLGPEESVPVVDLAHSLGIRTAGENAYEAGRALPEPSDGLERTKEHVLIYNSRRGTVGFLIDRAEAVVEAIVHPLPEALADADSSMVGLARTSTGTAYLIDLERHVPQR
jgi:chemotaxis signal transduction protein